MHKIEVFLKNEKVLEYTLVGPYSFADVYGAIQILWPGAIVQFPKEKKDVSKI